MFIESITEENLQQLVQLISKVSRAIERAPEGNLTVRQNGPYWYYRLSSGKSNETWHYIRHSKEDFARSLAQKGFRQAQLKDLINEELIVRKVLSMKSRHPITYLDQYLARPGIQYLLMREDLWQWAHEPYEKLENHSESKNHLYSEDISVRSKSEEMIISSLEKHGIPYRYEAKTQIGANEFYPDYTLRHPVSGNTLIWEHFGKMSDDRYRSDTAWKIQQYIQAGYTPGIDLIITSETPKSPLTFLKIEQIIKYYFG
ncbi:MAG: hypothetical protein IJM83_06175 [Firmicutes bacterium]|nr:hypothetical protein [Bacillota bacterium]